jgi:hypothetical protein
MAIGSVTKEPPTFGGKRCGDRAFPPLSPEVAKRVVGLTLAAPPPAASQRIWRARGLRPHRVRQFKLSSDPQFVAKLREIVGLYVLLERTRPTSAVLSLSDVICFGAIGFNLMLRILEYHWAANDRHHYQRDRNEWKSINTRRA